MYVLCACLTGAHLCNQEHSDFDCGVIATVIWLIFAALSISEKLTFHDANGTSANVCDFLAPMATNMFYKNGRAEVFAGLCWTLP